MTWFHGGYGRQQLLCDGCGTQWNGGDRWTSDWFVLYENDRAHERQRVHFCEAEACALMPARFRLGEPEVKNRILNRLYLHNRQEADRIAAIRFPGAIPFPGEAKVGP